MSTNDTLDRLLDLMLSTGRTPEQVCEDNPELLEEVRARRQRLARVEAVLRSVFPGSDEASRHLAAARAGSEPPVEIPGYALTELLGTGGMGVVYRGVQLGLDRVVAVKMLLANSAAGKPFGGSLSSEARSIAALRHPNIVQVYDLGEVDGYAYLTMEYIEGGTLADQLGGVPTSAGRAARLTATVSRAIEAAHRAGIVHCDIKPANILLAADGTPKVSDFGIATRRLPGTQPLSDPTGRCVGTPSYMAPERFQSEGGPIDPASDVYSLGAVLYEMLTGRPPFQAESPAETQRQVLAQDPVPPSRLNGRVPRDLETICLKCLQRDPSRRYPTAAALAEDIERFERREPIVARPVRPIERGLKWVLRNKALTVAGVAMLVLVASLSSFVLWRVSAQASAARAAELDLVEAVSALRASDWVAAQRAIDRGELRLRGGGPANVGGRLDRAKRDVTLAVRLQAIRFAHPGTVDADTVTFDKRGYAAAFRDAGLGTSAEAAETVAERIRRSDIRPALVAAVADWAFFSEQGYGNAWLRDVLRRSDPTPDGWRDRALDPETYADPARCRALLADAPMTRDSLPILTALGRQLASTDVDPIPFLTQVQQRFPDDFWANESLANALFDAGRFTESIAYERAAVALQPNLAWLQFNLGSTLWRLNDMEAAIVAFRRAIELNPSLYPPRAYLAGAYLHSKRYEEALAAADGAVELDPTIATCHVYRGDACRLLKRDDEAAAAYGEALALDEREKTALLGLRRLRIDQGRTDDALALWRRAIIAHPADATVRDGYAEYCLSVRRFEEYERARTELLARITRSNDPDARARAALACLLTPPASEKQARLIDALVKDAGDVNELAKGLAKYRAGAFEEAITWVKRDVESRSQPAAHVIAAMAYARLGRVADAEDALASASAAEPESSSSDAPDRRELWIYRCLRSEAETLLNAAAH